MESKKHLKEWKRKNLSKIRIPIPPDIITAIVKNTIVKMKKSKSERKLMKAKIYVDGELMFIADCKESSFSKEECPPLILKDFVAIKNKIPLSPYDAIRKMTDKMCHIETDNFTFKGHSMKVQYVAEWHLDGEHTVVIKGHKLDGIERAQLRLK